MAGLALLAASLPLGLTDRSLASLNTASQIIPYDCLLWSQSLHGLISGLGGLLLAMATVRAARGQGFGLCLTLPALALVVCGELFGRMAFYLSYSRLGM
jgi:hypothetical protein